MTSATLRLGLRVKLPYPGRKKLTSFSRAGPRGLISPPGGLSLGDAERHHGYWKFELKRGHSVVNQINVSECAGHSVIDEQMWQPDMVGTYAPHG